MIKKIVVVGSHPVDVPEDHFDWLNQFKWFFHSDGLPAMEIGRGRIVHMDTLIRARENPRMGCVVDKKGVVRLTAVLFDYLIDRG